MTDNEILMTENDQLNVVKVKKISSFVKQGINTFIFYHFFCKKYKED